MSDTNQTLIRSVLKIASGYLIAKGFGSDGDWEVIIGGVVAVVSVAWGVWHRSKP